MPQDVWLDRKRFTEHYVKCPDCGCAMKLRRTKDKTKVYYSCSGRGCGAYHTANEYGSPIGRPAPKALKDLRRKAQNAFGWVLSVTPLRKAYRWLETRYGTARISQFGPEDCQDLLVVIHDRRMARMDRVSKAISSTGKKPT